MNKTCLKCNYVNNEYDGSVFASCPNCEAIYQKVEAAISNKKNQEHKKLIEAGIKMEREQIAQEKKQLKKQIVCTDCLTVAKPTLVTPGSIFIEIILWLAMLLPGIIYSIWRHTNRYKTCPVCNKRNVIPATSPKGSEILNKTNAS